MPQSPEEAIKRGVIKASNFENMYHRHKNQTDNVKYYNKKTGQEIIFDANAKVVTDIENIGTYNYFPASSKINDIEDIINTFLHVPFDVIPYYRWGNSSNDTTPFEDRVFGPEIGLSIRFSLEEIQKVFYNILKKSPQIYKILENNDFYAIFY